MSEQRYTICGDDSGHKYFVKAEDVNDFYTWVESFDIIGSEYEGPEFTYNRIDGCFTFTDPKCE